MVAQAFQEIPKSHCIVSLWLITDACLVGMQLVDWRCGKEDRGLLQAAPKFGEELPSMAWIGSAKGRFWSRWLGGGIAYILGSAFPSRAGWLLRIRSLLFRSHPCIRLILQESMTSWGSLPLRNCHQLCRRCPVLAGCHFTYVVSVSCAKLGIHLIRAICCGAKLRRRVEVLRCSR